MCAIDHFTVVDLVPLPSSECEADGDLVLMQTSFALLWKLSLKNTSYHKNNLFYIIKQEGLYQNKVTFSLAFVHVMDKSEANGDLVLIQTFLLYYVKQVILMLTSIFLGQFP